MYITFYFQKSVKILCNILLFVIFCGDVVILCRDLNPNLIYNLGIECQEVICSFPVIPSPMQAPGL